MKIVAVINQKGGVGKTTTTVNLGAALARLGKQVLLMDLDPQSNLTLHVDRRPELETATMTHLLVEDRPVVELMQPTSTPGLSVIPADTSLGGVEQVLANRIGRETVLKEALEAYDGEKAFDYVLIDCPPSLGVLSANALVAAQGVVIPMQTEYFSLQGMAKLTEVIQLVQRRLNPELEIVCVLPCMVDLRTRLTGEVLDNIEMHFGDRLCQAFIRSNVKLAESPSFGATIFDHAPNSNGAGDYWDFAVDFLRRFGEEVDAALLQEVSGRVPVEEEEEEADELEAEADESLAEDEFADEDPADEDPADEEPEFQPSETELVAEPEQPEPEVDAPEVTAELLEEGPSAPDRDSLQASEDETETQLVDDLPLASPSRISGPWRPPSMGEAEA